jgi:hypothetical protein
LSAKLLSTKLWYKCNKAKVKERVPFSKKEELFFLTLCLWQVNFFFSQSRKGAKAPSLRKAGRKGINFFFASSRAFFLHAIP